MIWIAESDNNMKVFFFNFEKKEIVSAEFDRMQDNGIIQQIYEHANWILSLLIMPKKDTNENLLLYSSKDYGAGISSCQQ